MPLPRYRDHKGRLSEYPTDKEVAVREGLPKYLRPVLSPRCVCGCEALYVENDECIFCMVKAKWSEAQNAPDKFPVTIEGALDLGLDYVLTPEPCVNGPHLISKSLDGRRGCATCKRTLSPRAQALKDGEKWYTPKRPCVHCRERAPKRTYDGKCLGCHPPSDHRTAKMDEPTRVLMESAPDTIIDWSTAKAMNLTAYRTGRQCNKGHAEWRYVSTRGCITCHRQRGKL